MTRASRDCLLFVYKSSAVEQEIYVEAITSQHAVDSATLKDKSNYI